MEIIILSSEKPGSETIVKEKCLTCGWHRRGHRQCDEGGGLDADVVVIMTIVNYSFGLEAVGDRWVSVLDHIVKKREGKKEGCEVTVPVEKSLGFFLSFFLSFSFLSVPRRPSAPIRRSVLFQQSSPGTEQARYSVLRYAVSTGR